MLDRRTEVSVPQDPDIDEAQVLSVVINAFSPLSADARKRLLQTVATFFDLGLPGSQANRPNPTDAPPIKPGNFSLDRSANAKDFLHEKDPDSETERFVCLAYYLTHYRGVQHFKTLDITELNTEAAQIKFSNSAAVANNALKQGLLGPAPGGQKQLTARGERFVSLLPDSDAARAAIANSRAPRRSKRKASKAD